MQRGSSKDKPETLPRAERKAKVQVGTNRMSPDRLGRICSWDWKVISRVPSIWKEQKLWEWARGFRDVEASRL